MICLNFTSGLARLGSSFCSMVCGLVPWMCELDLDAVALFLSQARQVGVECWGEQSIQVTPRVLDQLACGMHGMHGISQGQAYRHAYVCDANA